MDFWDTVLGHRLADVLIRTLPKLAREQYTKTVKKEALPETINKEINKGNRYITHISTGDNDDVFVIFEREE